MDHQKPSEKSGCSLPFFPISFFCSPGTSFFDRIRLSFDRHAANQRLIKKKEINRDRSNETRQSTNDRHSKKKRKKRNKREKKVFFFPLWVWAFHFHWSGETFLFGFSFLSPSLVTRHCSNRIGRRWLDGVRSGSIESGRVFGLAT